MRQIRIRSAARADIKGIAETIGKDRPRSARRFFFAAEKLMKRVLDFPELGGLYESNEEDFEGLRVLSIKGFKTYLLFYRVHDDSVEVVRVLHGARDIPAILKGRS
jgi:toxin ParE1/3/4